MIRFSNSSKLISIFFAAAFIFILQQAISNASGAPTGGTGAPSEGNCTSCHTGTAVTNSSAVSVYTNMTNGQYIPDSVYQIKIRTKKTGCVKFGFSTTLLNSNATPTKLGTLQVPSGNSKVQLSTGTRDYMTQTSSGTAGVYTDSTEWIINWKAPSTLSGDARLYIAAVASNNDALATGDETHVKDFTFPQTTNVPVASITTNVNTSCTNDSVYFQASGTNGTSAYEWIFPGGTPATSTAQNQWVKFTNGTKVCSLRVANSIMYSAYVTKSVTIYNPPNANISYNNSTLLCDGDSISMNTSPGTGFTYQWKFNGNNIPGANAVQYFAKLTGNYQIVVTNGNGCSTLSSPVSLSFNPSPTAVLASENNVTSTCQGDTLLLKTNGGSGYSYYWYKDNVLLTQSLDSTFYVYQTGDYSVRIFSTIGCSRLSNTVSINFYNKPSGTIASQTDSICAGDFVRLSAFNLDTIVLYQWYKDSVPINGANQQEYDVTTAGSYMVDMLSNRGCKTTLPAKSIKVNPLPQTNYIDTARNGCSYILQIRYPGNYTYQWMRDGGIYAVNSASQTITQSGTYNVIITNQYGCTVTTNSITITIPLPPANFIDSVRVGCAYKLKLRNPGNYNWQWQLDGITFNAQDSIITATQSGTYAVLVSNNQGCSIYTNSLILTIPVNIPDTALTPKSNAEFCSDSSGVTYRVPAVTGMVYRWYRNGSLISGANSNSYNAKDSGNYYVAVDNGFCVFNSAIRNVKVNLTPVISVSGNSAFCSGDSLVLNTNASSGVTYQWYKDNQPLANSNIATWVAKAGGVYFVKATLGNCSKNSNSITVTENPLPTIPVISKNKNVLTSTAATSYQWYKDGIIITGATQQSYTIAVDGSYAVQITDANGCKNSSVSALYTFTGIAVTSHTDFITVAPNPVTENLFITFNSTANRRLVVTDASGRILITRESNSKNEIIDFSTLASGVYFVNVTSANSNGVVRVVKQ